MADNDYKVGYKRPPLETRFKKGVSGCPDGGAEIKKKKKAERERRAAQRTVGDVLRDICNEQVPVTINGKRTKMAKLEIMVRKVVDQAATGDRPAFKDVRDLLARTGQLKPPAERGDQRSGVLVVTPVRSREDWERATEGHRLPKDPLHGIPGAEGLLSDAPPPRRAPPDDDDD